MDDAEKIAEQTLAQNVSKKPSARLRHINSRAEEWTDMSRDSCLFIFAWTGRVCVETGLLQGFRAALGRPFTFNQNEADGPNEAPG
jgi:hypothetical protein